MTLNKFRHDITRRALAGESFTSIARRYNVSSAGISLAIKRWGVKVSPRVGHVGRPIGASTFSTLHVPSIASLPILPSGFIRSPTKSELMAGKSYGR